LGKKKNLFREKKGGEKIARKEAEQEKKASQTDLRRERSRLLRKRWGTTMRKKKERHKKEKKNKTPRCAMSYDTRSVAPCPGKISGTALRGGSTRKGRTIQVKPGVKRRNPPGRGKKTRLSKGGHEIGGRGTGRQRRELTWGGEDDSVQRGGRTSLKGGEGSTKTATAKGGSGRSGGGRKGKKGPFGKS